MNKKNFFYDIEYNIYILLSWNARKKKKKCNFRHVPSVQTKSATPDIIDREKQYFVVAPPPSITVETFATVRNGYKTSGAGSPRMNIIFVNIGIDNNNHRRPGNSLYSAARSAYPRSATTTYARTNDLETFYEYVIA